MELTSHKVNGLNEQLQIVTRDEPGSGGAYHEYEIIDTSKENAAGGHGEVTGICDVKFQNGPISEVGVNGVSAEALLAIVEHRLNCFQSGPFACRENALALIHLQESMDWLHHRTRERMARGVEGTMAK